MSTGQLDRSEAEMAGAPHIEMPGSQCWQGIETRYRFDRAYNERRRGRRRA